MKDVLVLQGWSGALHGQCIRESHRVIKYTMMPDADRNLLSRMPAERWLTSAPDLLAY